MANAQFWTFTQLDGPQKTMTLSGWAAPFGRPRQGPIVNAGLKVNDVVTNYPGGSRRTVHSFAVEKKPFELHGRWMDQGIGQIGAAKQLHRDWQDFLSDQVLVRAQWGNILSYKVFLDDIDLQFESEAEVIWSLKGVVLEDEAAPVELPDTPTRQPIDMGNEMMALLAAATPFAAPSYFNLRGMLSDIADTYDNLVATINAPAAAVFEVCSALSDFETAIASDLTRMLSGIQTIRTGILQLRNTTSFIVSGAVLLNSPNSLAINDLQGGLFSGVDMTRLTTDKAASDRAAANLLALLTDLESQIRLKSRGQVVGAVQAQDGDTWTTVASRTSGGIDAARDLRAMNAVRYGKKPQGGKKYSVPRRV